MYSSYEHPEQVECWNCVHWHGQMTKWPILVCQHRGETTVIAQPERGCAYWTLDPRKAPFIATLLAGD